MVAAAFLRFDGTDGLLAEQGPGRLAAAVDELVRNVQDSMARHGVSLHESDVDVDGGKLMLLAGAPLSTGDDVDHLVSAVRLVVGRAGELPLRAGIAHGRVFTGDLGPGVAADVLGEGPCGEPGRPAGGAGRGPARCWRRSSSSSTRTGPSSSRSGRR